MPTDIYYKWKIFEATLVNQKYAFALFTIQLSSTKPLLQLSDFLGILPLSIGAPPLVVAV